MMAAHEKPLHRCPWVDLSKPDYVAYHDTEWGVPVHDDRKHFEFLILEGAQAGLSWYTILKRRASYRAAFANFDPQVVARFDKRRIEALLQESPNVGIIRNRLKVEAAVNNAQRFLDLVEERGSFSDYIWEFVGGQPIINRPHTLAGGDQRRPANTAKRRGRARATRGGCRDGSSGRLHTLVGGDQRRPYKHSKA